MGPTSWEKLAIASIDGQLLVIYHAEPGTGSAEKLGLLASLAGSTTPGDGDRAESDRRERSEAHLLDKCSGSRHSALHEERGAAKHDAAAAMHGLQAGE
jgi:hypothetical protein